MIRRRAGNFSPALAAAALVAILAPAPSARAQPAQAAVAEALFQEGRRLMDEKRFAEACPKLAESFKLDPAGGTLLNLALCHEQEGKLATAWAEQNQVLNLARKAGRSSAEKLAREKIDELERRVPRLTIVVPPAVDVPGLEIRRAGAVLGRAAWGTPLPVDPGEQGADVSAPGKRAVHLSARLAEGQTVTLTVPVLVDAAVDVPAPAASQSAPAATAAPPASQAAPPATPPPAGPAPRGAARTAGGYAALGVGVLALGIGTYFGVEAVRQRRASDADCPAGACNQAGWDTYLDGQRAARTANVALVVGAVGLAVGGVLLWLPVASGDRASVGVGPGQARLVARW
jgi:hypothetical protein